MNTNNINASDIQNACKGLQMVVDAIAEERKPYEMQMHFIKYYRCSGLIYLQQKNKFYTMYERHALFAPMHLESGDIVTVDKRFINIK